jgi:hypothetical protein
VQAFEKHGARVRASSLVRVKITDKRGHLSIFGRLTLLRQDDKIMGTIDNGSPNTRQEASITGRTGIEISEADILDWLNMRGGQGWLCNETLKTSS